MKKLFWQDSETTGINPLTDQMLSYAMVVTDESLQILGHIYVKIKLLPHVTPSPGALAVNKIDPYGLEWAMTAFQENEAIKMISDFVDQHAGIENYLLAYNGGFDNRFLAAALDRNNTKIHHIENSISVDPLLMAKQATSREIVLTPSVSSRRKDGSFYSYRSNKLEDVSKTLGTQHEGEAHNALNDVYTLIKTAPVIYHKLTGKPFAESLKVQSYQIPFRKQDLK